jgi:hypothetical protein
MAAENLPEWRTAMWATQDLARDVLGPALEHMNAALARLPAGQTQRRLTSRWPGWMTEIASQGDRIITTWNPRLTRAADGLAAAGGADEVYGDKRAATDS